ncbi:uncharacterized protein [Leptinotarsa decemlineata]|uniref:uncharacterized protein n=1 Tax=Leptinotarsa decemlineata TaxID=7539 RepID=UPI003D30925C
MAFATAKENDSDLLIVSEPNKNTTKGLEWMKDKNHDVSVLLLNRKIEIQKVKAYESFISIKTKGLTVICCYISPNIPIGVYKEKVNEIMEVGRRTRKRCIILGDIYAKSVLWGSPVSDPRGDYWAEWLAALDMVVMNTGLEPTFTRGESRSFIDVTCCTQDVALGVGEWRVLTKESLSDHQFIQFFVEGIGVVDKYTWTKVEYDWKCFKTLLKWTLELAPEDILNGTSGCQATIKEILKASLKQSTGEKTKNPYWWNDEI